MSLRVSTSRPLSSACSEEKCTAACCVGSAVLTCTCVQSNVGEPDDYEEVTLRDLATKLTIAAHPVAARPSRRHVFAQEVRLLGPPHLLAFGADHDGGAEQVAVRRIVTSVVTSSASSASHRGGSRCTQESPNWPQFSPRTRTATRVGFS